MPVQVSYPGVYVQEAESGVHAITGVATSITAFVGRSIRGPINRPVTVNSFAEMTRVFGGLWTQSRLAFAVRDFFLNGGTRAIVVRLFKAAGTGSASLTLRDGTLTLAAASPGLWGNHLQAVVDHDTRPPQQEFGETATSLFNLSVRDSATKVIEVFRNVSIEPANPRYLRHVLKNESALVEWVSDTGAQPQRTSTPAPGTDVWADANSADHDVVTIVGNDGAALDGAAFTTGPAKTGLGALELADLFNLLVIPPFIGADDRGNPNDVDPAVIAEAESICKIRNAFLLLDSPSTWQTKPIGDIAAVSLKTELGVVSENAAVFFPRLVQPNPLRGNQLEWFCAAGAVAGVFARTDAQRGVWKAPAGLSATLSGVPALTVTLTDPENGQLNPEGINCLRVMQGTGPVVWGSRTLEGADRLASQSKYIPVRRFTLFLKETLYRSMQWVVFEPNDEPLWGQIRLNINAFMQGLFRQGAFQGTKPNEAYFVKCDRETTTQADIDLGVVNIVVGFAPLKPAEFVVITLRQLAGQAAT